jgi:hypothetical protein
MELESLFGLPAHPLVVHAAVVLLPLAAIATVLVALVPGSRRHYAPIVLGLALVATLAVGLAQGSGEALEERVDETALVEAHTSQGERVLPWAIGVTVVALGATVAGPLRRRYPGLTARRVTAVLVVTAALAGAGATWTVVDVGHSGAKATWDRVDDGEAGG